MVAVIHPSTDLARGAVGAESSVRRMPREYSSGVLIRALLLVLVLFCGCVASPWDDLADDDNLVDVPGVDDDDSSSDDDDSAIGDDDDTTGDDDDSTEPPPPDPPQQLTPCANGDCWTTAISAPPCSSSAVPENFSTGLYNVHSYATALAGGWGLRLELERTGGSWDPVLVVALADGEVISDGAIGLMDVDRGIEVTTEDAGLSGSPAAVLIESEFDLNLTVFATGWHVLDGDFTPAMPGDSTYTLVAESLCPPDAGLYAPAGTLTGEFDLATGANSLSIGSGSWGAPGRVDTAPGEYVGFKLEFSPSSAAVDMQVLIWDGVQATAMATTNAGPGIRVLASRDPDIGRTFWVRAEGSPSSGMLILTRTPLSELPPCSGDCGALLQLPLPVASTVQGYGMTSDVVYREQFGRRDLMEAILYAGRQVSALGMQPFTLKDLSNWDGTRPPGHETHNDGYHADLSLYTASGSAIWYGLCGNDGTHCTGAANNFGAEHMARFVGALFETGVPSSIYLDDVLIDEVEDAADDLLAAGEMTAAVHGIIHSDALRHVNYHHHHIHVRADGI
jgi:hypothetical protein